MIPKLEQINIGQDIEIVEQLTYTYRLNIDKNRAVGYIDKLEAMKQAIYKILMTDRYKYLIYNWNYGFEISDLIGKPRAFVYPELKRRITEALLVDDRITAVDSFEFEETDRAVVLVKFTVHTTFGEVEASKEVSI
ncbi:DUF2634 domain-containing protein [Geosporobacter ferrireducens]|uniref:DUF2634 domain-containing protein n=1 Tax=Geosporobacter ferrireducens TaxID=1424294 RepID=UPI00139E6B18|nr:DUF2634 domain-containing protein [Geosporobacter ferrireducens]MTI56164.1 DUF2634 domain-containing protein [Geosporobacter ferrireducens]